MPKVQPPSRPAGLPIIHPLAADIDIGSRFHVAAVSPDRCDVLALGACVMRFLRSSTMVNAFPGSMARGLQASVTNGKPDLGAMRQKSANPLAYRGCAHAVTLGGLTAKEVIADFADHFDSTNKGSVVGADIENSE